VNSLFSRHVFEFSEIPVYVYKQIDLIQCGGIEVRNLKASAIARRKPLGDPVLEKFQFVPHISVQVSVVLAAIIFRKKGRRRRRRKLTERSLRYFLFLAVRSETPSKSMRASRPGKYSDDQSENGRTIGQFCQHRRAVDFPNSGRRIGRSSFNSGTYVDVASRREKLPYFFIR